MKETLVLLIFLLFTKHFVIDFLLQTEYQWKNKGTYGHPGGILHAGLHGVATILILACFMFIPGAVLFGIVDAVIHYHIDWTKMKINSEYKLEPNGSSAFWVLLGLDQYLHALTYILILGIVS